LGRIITHYKYAFTSEQGTSSEILMRDGVKSRLGQDDCIGTLCTLLGFEIKNNTCAYK